MNFSSFAGRMKTAGPGPSPAVTRLLHGGGWQWRGGLCVSQVFKIAEKVLTRANFVESTVRLQL